MQAFLGHVGPDVEFPTPRNRDQCRVDFPDGLGDALLRLGHRRDGRGGVLLDVRLPYLGGFLLVKALGVGLDSLRVERLPGVDGQADALGEPRDFSQKGLDTLQLFLAFLRVDGQAVVEITFLAVLGAEHAVYLVHHVLDVRDRRRQRGLGLHQLAHGLAERDNLPGALRGIDVNGVVYLVILFLGHVSGCFRYKRLVP